MFLNFITFDAPFRNTFQDPLSLFAEYIIDLHNIVLILIGFLVFFVGSLILLIIVKLPNIESIPNRLISMLNIYGNEEYKINPVYLNILGTSNKVRRLNSGILLEFIWTLIPCIFLICIAIPSISLLYFMDEVHFPTLNIKVLGSQWYWTYDNTYCYVNPTNLKVTKSIVYDSYLVEKTDLNKGEFRLLQVDNPLYIPVFTDIRLLVTANDVIHSFAVPSYGVKIDAIPGRLNQIFMFAKREGIAYGQCSELCGVNHYAMPIQIISYSLENIINSIK